VTAQSALERTTYRRVARRLIPLLFLCYIAAYLDRVNVGFAKLEMAQDLGLSDTVYGLGAGIFFLGYFLFEVPSNLILQRVGARLWIARIMIVWGVVSAATMLVRGETSFYLMRFLLGLAEAGFFPGVILYLTQWFPPAHRARMTAFFMTAVAAAGIIGGPVSGWILGHLGGVAGWAGWQWLYLLEGVPSIVIGLWVLAYLDDDPSKARWLSEDERALLLRRLEEERAAKQLAGEHRTTLLEAFRSSRVWLLCLVYFSLAMGVYGVSFWLPQIIKDTLTRDPVEIGWISAIPWVVAAVVMVGNGRHSDRTGERRWHVAIPSLVSGAGFALAALPHLGGWTGVAALTLAAAGVLSAMSCFWSMPPALLSGSAAAAGIAWINSVGNLAGYVSPSVVGKIRDVTGSMAPALGLLAASLVLAAILALAVRTRSSS
jgi:D-galactonate transporter